ncbi:MAG: lytic transglycosylase domain-containing protein [Synergistaceae bacterium]|jgi:soluble lytic murein transglycosylase-like protein|nr:lytic transglycosylase domain-containing protein [Synergistaceae bacterium]
MTNVNKVLDRIDEIVRKCAAVESARPAEARLAEARLAEARLTEAGKARFVDVLDDSRKKQDAGPKGRADARSSVDDLRKLVSRYAGEYNIDEELVRAVIQVESGWKPDAVSVKGAKGLMQLMPRTAAMLGVEDAFDPQENIEGGVKYLSRLTDKYDGDVEMALAAYNAGPARVDAAGGAPFSETSRYVRNVMALYHRYREES